MEKRFLFREMSYRFNSTRTNIEQNKEWSKFMAKFYLINYSGEYVKDIRIQNCRRKKKARYFYTPCLLEEEALAFKDNWTAHTFSGLLNCSVKEGGKKV